jgi:FAD/FMN-containing dehydrogenase
MNRRNLLMGGAAAATAPIVAAIAAPVLAASAGRVRPGDPRWPSEAQWEGLKRQVGGNLVKPTPLAAACTPDPKSQACHDFFKNAANPFWIGDQPGGTQVSGWLDAWSPAISAYAVAATSAADVAAAVTFARRHNLRLAVKGGAHSYQGTSNAPDSLLVWTRKMRSITLHDAFVPTGCGHQESPKPAVTAEAGCMWIDLYDAVTTKAGRYVQGGGCTTVGIAGLVQSGGFGSFSKRFGLASASLLEAEVVTADGQIRTANPCTNPDLFWALKGGGGGSLGVITKLTLQTHDLPEILGGTGGQIKAASPEAFERLVDRFLAFYGESLCNPHWGESVDIRPDNVLKISMVNLGLDEAAQKRIWAPFLDWVRAAPADYTFKQAVDFGDIPARQWWDAVGRRKRGSTSMHYDNREGVPPEHAWWSGDQDQVGAFFFGYDSIWLPASMLVPAERGRMAAALVAGSRHASISLHFNKGLAGAPPAAIAGARNIATNPDVQDAFALAIIANGWLMNYPGAPVPPASPAFAHKQAAAVDMAAAELRKVAPGRGSYVSESNYFNADWRRAFWGANYPRLKAVKARYDPHGLFIVHHGVGSEDWSADGFTRLVGA